MIQTQRITKSYKNGFQAVKGLNLTVDKGDIFGFLGPNGAGKTTTIRMLNGLLRPTEGSIQIAGMDIKKHPIEIRRLIGVVPESHGYYEWMTAREYLEYFSSLFGKYQRKNTYLDQLLERVGLAEKAGVPIGQFSRGMKQRLGIAKSLINKPEIIFLDEPTLGLDPKGQKEIQELLLSINHNDKITIFITSHLLKDIEVLCNKVSIIKDGILIEQGSMQELQQKYMGQYIVALQTSNNAAAFHMIKSLEGVDHVQKLSDDCLEVTLDKDLSQSDIHRVKNQILSNCFTSHIDVEEMRHKTPGMEDIFFRAIETEEQK